MTQNLILITLKKEGGMKETFHRLLKRNMNSRHIEIVTSREPNRAKVEILNSLKERTIPESIITGFQTGIKNFNIEECLELKWQECIHSVMAISLSILLTLITPIMTSGIVIFWFSTVLFFYVLTFLVHHFVTSLIMYSRVSNIINEFIVNYTAFIKTFRHYLIEESEEGVSEIGSYDELQRRILKRIRRLEDDRDSPSVKDKGGIQRILDEEISMASKFIKFKY